MILCDFDDLNSEEFHLQFFNTVVQGNIELISEVLAHPKLSKQFDISYKNYYCIIASLLNSQQVNDCHFELLKLFTESPLLKKHANPSLCSQEDIFCGALGNAIIFTPIETIRFIGKFYTEDKLSKLDDLFALSIFNNKKEAFFYLAEERHFQIEKPDLILKALINFPHVDSSIVDYIKKVFRTKKITSNDSEKTNNEKMNATSSKPKTKPTNSQSVLLNLSHMKNGSSQNYWGSKFRQNF